MTTCLHRVATSRLAQLCAWVIGLGFLLAATPSIATAARQELRVAFTATAFSGVNRADAEAAFKVFVRTMGVKRGWDVVVDVQMFAGPGGIDAAIEAGSVNLLVLDAWTYLASTAESSFEPVFVSSEGGKATKQLLLLTHRDAGLDTLEALHGQALIVQSASNATLGRYWMETLCGDRGVGTPESFFASIELSPKPTQAVLPVFFRKKAACLVDSVSYATMTELNPQLGRELRVVASSEPMVDTVICMRREGWADARFRANVIQALAELHLEAAGQQILTLFRSGPLLAYEDQHLRTVRRLHSKAAALAAQHNGTAPDPTALPATGSESR